MQDRNTGAGVHSRKEDLGLAFDPVGGAICLEMGGKMSLCHVHILGPVFFCLFICPFYVTYFLDIEQIAGKQLLKGPFLCKIHFICGYLFDLSTSPPVPEMKRIEYCFLCLLIHVSEMLCLENPDLEKQPFLMLQRALIPHLHLFQGRDSTESQVF